MLKCFNFQDVMWSLRLLHKCRLVFGKNYAARWTVLSMCFAELGVNKYCENSKYELNWIMSIVS
jgi:hypothetical protein